MTLVTWTDQERKEVLLDIITTLGLDDPDNAKWADIKAALQEAVAARDAGRWPKLGPDS